MSEARTVTEEQLEELDGYLESILPRPEDVDERMFRVAAAKHLLRDSQVVSVDGAGWMAAYLAEVEHSEKVAIAARKVLYWFSKASTSPVALQEEQEALNELYRLVDR